MAIDSFDRIVVSDAKAHKLSMFDGGFKLIGQCQSIGDEFEVSYHQQESQIKLGCL